MAALSPGAPRRRPEIPGATLSLLSLASSELRRDLRRLLDTRWEEPVRRRAEELATTLVDACRRQGIPDLIPRYRSIANLARLSRADATPVLPALREKFEALLREIDAILPKRPDRSPG